jgi:hypothetical protein
MKLGLIDMWVAVEGLNSSTHHILTCFPSDASAGQSSHRQSWSQYFQATSGVILVIDSTDRARMDLVRQELLKMMSDEVSRLEQGLML